MHEQRCRLPAGDGAGGAMAQVLHLMRALRASTGCPWDREQTLASLRRYLVEECCETLEAIDSGDRDAHREELGDLLLQIVFQSQIREEEGAFAFEDVAVTLAEKLVRRHPHVFGEASAATVGEVERHWAAIKAREKPARARGALGEVPRELPAAAVAETLQRRAARVGFDWPDADGALRKVEEELAEVRVARASGSPAAIEEEVGDLLFAAVNAGRLCGVGCEDALRAATRKFRRRFEQMEALVADEGLRIEELGLEALDQRWSAVKRAETRLP